MKKLLTTLFFICIVIVAVYLQWWKCGEMFPHAQVACFIGGK